MGKFAFYDYFKILIFKSFQNMPTTVLKHRYGYYKFLETDLTSFGVINQKIRIKWNKTEN